MGAAAARTPTLGRKAAFKYLNCSQAAIIQLARLAVLTADWMRLERQLPGGAFQAWRSREDPPESSQQVVERDYKRTGTGTDRLMEPELTHSHPLLQSAARLTGGSEQINQTETSLFLLAVACSSGRRIKKNILSKLDLECGEKSIFGRWQRCAPPPVILLCN